MPKQKSQLELFIDSLLSHRFVAHLIFFLDIFFSQKNSSFVNRNFDLRRRVYSVFEQIERTDVIRHFLMQNMARSIMCSFIKRLERALPCDSKPREEHPAKFDKMQQQELKTFAGNRVDISQRKLALKFNVPKTCIQKKLKEMSLKYCKRQCTPNTSQIKNAYV